MTPERWEQVGKLYQAALELKVEERDAFLDRACAGDLELRREVASLLAAEAKAGSFLAAGAIEDATKIMAEEDPPSLAGKTLGHYRLLSLVGSGGMGEVYLAQDTRLDRRVALKFLPSHLAQDAERLHRFEQEARAASALNHPNIITIYEIGSEGNQHFIATEFIEGETLRHRITRSAMGSGTREGTDRLGLELMEGLRITEQIASALSEAHARGIVHRDIKPDNVMLRRDGIVKVLDFGLAKLTEGRETGPEESTRALIKTSTGVVMGTVAYMSPEQARGLQLDARTDIWSLGVVLYESIAGHSPFEGPTSSDSIAAILEREPQPITDHSPQAPEELRRIISKALRKDREERYQVVKDMLLDLKNLREELEFKDQLKRSQTTKPGGEQTKARTAGAVETQAGDSEPARSVSSAEYVVSEIRRHRIGVLVFLLILVVTAAALGYFYFAPRDQTINSLAVLPFVNTNADPNIEYLSDGIAESLTDSLAELPNLRVMSHNSALRYKGREADAQAVGRQLGVQAVLTGRIVERNDELSIGIELVNAADNSHIWGAQYNRKLSDLLSLQEEISQEIVERLRLKLSGEQARQLTKRYTENPEAYQLLLKARYSARRFTPDSWLKAIDFYNQAIAIAPNYAPAYAGLAIAYTELANFESPAQPLLRAKEAASRALKLDDTLADAHIALGVIKMYYDWDQPGAQEEFERAVALSPGDADSHNWYGWILALMGRFDESMAELRRAQSLDPLSNSNSGAIGANFFWSRQYDRAIEQYQKAIELDPNYAMVHIFLGEVYGSKGDFSKAFAEFDKAGQLGFARTPVMEAELGYVYGVSGDRSHAEKILSEMERQSAQQYISPFYIAVVHVGLGDKEETLRWLEKAYEEHSVSLSELKVDPRFDSLRSEPRFTALLRRVGFAS